MERVAIPSKGRPDSKFLQSNENFFIFVEPQEYDVYKSSLPQHKIVNILQNDMGTMYVRNYIIGYMKFCGIPYYWMIDDDITGFFYREGTKLIKCSTEEALSGAEEQFKWSGTNLGALSYRHLAWCAKKDLESNCACLVCMYISNIDTVKFRWFGGCNMDNDFSMQCVKQGLVVNRSTLYAFSTPVPGTNAGGLQEVYLKINKSESYDRFVAEWGEHIVKKFIKPDGTLATKINWKSLKINSIKF